jgi:hypothetical protein
MVLNNVGHAERGGHTGYRCVWNRGILGCGDLVCS